MEICSFIRWFSIDFRARARIRINFGAKNAPAFKGVFKERGSFRTRYFRNEQSSWTIIIAIIISREMFNIAYFNISRASDTSLYGFERPPYFYMHMREVGALVICSLFRAATGPSRFPADSGRDKSLRGERSRARK